MNVAECGFNRRRSSVVERDIRLAIHAAPPRRSVHLRQSYLIPICLETKLRMAQGPSADAEWLGTGCARRRPREGTQCSLGIARCLQPTGNRLGWIDPCEFGERGQF